MLLVIIQDAFQCFTTILGNFLLFYGYWHEGIIILEKFVFFWACASREIDVMSSLLACGYDLVSDGGSHDEYGRENYLEVVAEEYLG